MEHPLFPAVLLGLCSLFCILLALHGLHRVLERGLWDRQEQLRIYRAALFVLAAWVLLLGVLAWRGFFAQWTKVPPRIGMAAMLPLPVVLWITFSKKGRELLRSLPPQWPIYLQSFRIVVEIVLWLCVRDGALPVQMSFEGRNFDILTGLFALPVGYYCYVKKSAPSWVALLYNIGGLLLLVNVVAIAVLSMPTPLRAFHNEPANTLVAYFPFIYIPGLMVPLAYTLHIFSLRLP
ncbi:MAG TPA: hypothetical protein VHD83_22365 [Puia sp.]|nr:hypothetical protein [Puia sp.]